MNDKDKRDLEKVFADLDNILHGEDTYSALEDRCLGLEVENDELTDTITIMREINRGE